MIVVGAGRVGTALKARADERDVPCALVSRTDGWEALEGAQGDPVVLAVRNDDLLDVMARIPQRRRSDLVFVQNGAIRDFLRENGQMRATRGLLYFAVARQGDPISPGGTNWFSGPHGLALARWFAALGLDAEDVDWGRFSFYELEKLCWICAFGPLCERYQATVGQVVAVHREPLEALVAEFHAIGRAAIGVDVPLDYLMSKLCAYSESIPDYRASVKEFPWRNGWFVRTAARYRIDIPVQTELFSAIGRDHLLRGGADAPEP